MRRTRVSLDWHVAERLPLRPMACLRRSGDIRTPDGRQRIPGLDPMFAE
jgi:hypothetical protein